MIDLNKEAEEYCIKIVPRYDTIIESNIRYFIAEANSKFVKQQIIQAQIDLINKLGNGNKNALYGALKLELINLQQELKQLQNE